MGRTKQAKPSIWRIWKVPIPSHTSLHFPVQCGRFFHGVQNSSKALFHIFSQSLSRVKLMIQHIFFSCQIAAREIPSSHICATLTGELCALSFLKLHPLFSPYHLNLLESPRSPLLADCLSSSPVSSVNLLSNTSPKPAIKIFFASSHSQEEPFNGSFQPDSKLLAAVCS